MSVCLSAISVSLCGSVTMFACPSVFPYLSFSVPRYACLFLSICIYACQATLVSLCISLFPSVCVSLYLCLSPCVGHTERLTLVFIHYQSGERQAARSHDPYRVPYPSWRATLTFGPPCSLFHHTILSCMSKPEASINSSRWGRLCNTLMSTNESSASSRTHKHKHKHKQRWHRVFSSDVRCYAAHAH